MILDLTVTKAVKGTISGSFELTPEQIADLRNGTMVRADSIRARPRRQPVGLALAVERSDDARSKSISIR